LKKEWEFQCSCQRCAAEAHLVAESDDRVTQMKALIAELDNYSGTSMATPETAELLVLLFELEGVAFRLHEAYYRAAVEWNGVGRVIEATKYARLCLDRGLRLRGPDRPFIDSMKELVRNPEGHWSWRFRLGESK
jgi:hypothetical protein